MKNPQLLQNLGRKISTVRAFRGLSQQQLANLVYCHKSAISRIENGKQDPGVLIYAIAYALKCDANTFDPYQPNTLIIPETLAELKINN
ncbi:MAG: helix-turn-helix transcriptional regulator [Xenococcaceae cyanobacterium MO_234.B1]|nr:helix-turn-helix transcriptional regulator [Xenococcaceae cyanobacterium MO_234.B1]